VVEPTKDAALTDVRLHPILEGIDLVVFDKDGTLISFDAMWSGWARDLGSRLEIATRRPVAGDVFATIGYDPSTDRVLPGGPLAVATMAEIEEIVAAVLRRWCPSVAAARRILAEAWSVPDPVALAVPLADLTSLFSALAAADRRIGVATTDNRRPTEATLEALGIARFVTGIVCGDDPGPTKPDPAALTFLADRAGTSIDRTAMVGDTPADLAMARAAGVHRSIGVRSGVASDASLEPLADVLLDTIGDLVDIGIGPPAAPAGR
jgi:phosphoglycolate phosphatase-like HAD superfamily hydrolase